MRKAVHGWLVRAGLGLAAAVWATGLALTGCSTSASPGVRGAPAVEDVPILWQESGTYSRLSRRARILVRDPGTLAQVPLTEVPVDFETQMVLIAGLGPTPTGRQGIRIARVWREGSRLRVQETPIHPGADSDPGFDPASPWTAVVIPRSDLNVEGYDARVPQGLLRDHAGSR